MPNVQQPISGWLPPTLRLVLLAILAANCSIRVAFAEPSPARNADSAVKVAQTHEIQIYVTSWCPYCRKLEAYLQSRNYKYKRYDVELSEIGRRMHRQLGGGGIPVVVIDKTVIRGFNPQAIEAAMRDSDTSITM
jgi:glutaredoxin